MAVSKVRGRLRIEECEAVCIRLMAAPGLQAFQQLQLSEKLTKLTICENMTSQVVTNAFDWQSAPVFDPRFNCES